MFRFYNIGATLIIMDKYKTEARERWGDTSAYREHEEKTKNYLE